MARGSQSGTVDVRVEIPRGSRSKYEYNSERGELRLKRVLSASVHYPCDYGSIVGTLGEDGDELDVLLLTEEPAIPASIQEARPVGLLEMSDAKGVDHRVLAVPAQDPRFDEVRSLSDVPDHWRAEIKAFFDTYKQLDGGGPEVNAWRGVRAAWRMIDSAKRAYSKDTR